MDKRVFSSTKTNERGAVAVEFAIIAVILIWMLVGVVEFGAAYNEYQIMTGAAREGARVASVRGTVSQINSQIDAASSPYDGPTSVTIEVDGAASSDDPPCDADHHGDPVEVSWTHGLDVGIFGANVHRNVDIKGTFRCE